MTYRPNLLVVDDELGPRESLRMILRDDYDVITAANGEQAVQCLEKQEFDLIILDIRMPGLNGIDLLGIVKEKAPTTEAIMITAYASIETATNALRLGALDYLIKPFEYESVREVVRKGISRRDESRSIKNKISELQLANKSLENDIEKVYRNIQKHYKETVDSLVAAVDAKDSYTRGHQERVARLVWTIGKSLEMDEKSLSQLYRAANLHDIGKIGVAEHVLRKHGALNKEEYNMVKKHSVIGAEILSPVEFLLDTVPLVMHHHEKYDGSGYPNGLSGNSIPLGARIIALADAVDAMLWERPYGVVKSIFEVKEELTRVSGVHLDPEIVEIVLKENILDVYEEMIEN